MFQQTLLLVETQLRLLERNNMKIPFVDLKAQYLSIKDEIDDAISSVINDTAFIKGRYV